MEEIFEKTDGNTTTLTTTIDLEEELEEYKEEIRDLEKKLEIIDKNIESYPYEVPEVVKDYRESLNNFLLQSKRMYEEEIKERRKTLEEIFNKIINNYKR